MVYLVLFYLCQKMPVLYHQRVSGSRSVVSDSVTSWTIACQAPLSWDSPGKDTGVGSLSLLQGIFPTQGWNPGLLHYRPILLLSEPPGKLRSAQKEQTIR